MVVVLVWTVFGNLIHAVTAGVVLASILFMKQSGDLAEAESTVEKLEPEPAWDDEDGLANDPSILCQASVRSQCSSAFPQAFERLPTCLPTRGEDVSGTHGARPKHGSVWALHSGRHNLAANQRGQDRGLDRVCNRSQRIC